MKTIFITLVSAVVLVGSSRSELLAHYTFDDGAAIDSAGSTSVSAGNYLHVGSESTTFGEADGNPGGQVNTAIRWLNQSPVDEYHTFTLTVNGLAFGEKLEIDSVSYDWKEFAAGQNAYVGLYTDATGITADDRLDEHHRWGATEWENRSVNVSTNIPLQGLINGSTVQFYLVYYGNSASGRSITFDNIQVHGTIEDAIAPSKPAYLQVANGDGNVVVDWADNIEPDLLGYTIYRSNQSGVYGDPLAENLTESQYVDTDVTNGMPYYYAVKAVNAAQYESGLSETFAIPMARPIHSVKKGVGYAGEHFLRKQCVEALNTGWRYGWSMDRNLEINSNVEYAPMRHNIWWPGLEELANCGHFTELLTFNEPDHKKDTWDGKPTVQEALDFWPQFEAASETYGCRISSPACTGVYGKDGQWVTNFMTQAEALGLQVDFMNYHAYPSPNGLANHIRNQCDTLWATYGKPIWITEFNSADWNEDGAQTMVDTYTSMIELLHYLERTPYIERYAIFPFDLTWGAAAAPSHVFEVDIVDGQTNTTSRLTSLGHLYAEYRSVDVNGPYEDTWYYIHNRGSKTRLMNDGAAIMADIHTEGKAVQFEIVEAGGGTVFVVNRTTGERLGYNGSALFWAEPLESGNAVQWSIIDDAHGWDRIEHAGSGQLLRANPLGVVSPATSDYTVHWAFVRANALPTDIDGDDLPDDWEFDSFTSLLASDGGEDNYDGDSYPDTAERIAGTDAADAGSFFHISKADFNVGFVEMTFDGVANRTYVLETTGSLMSNDWVVVDSVESIPTNGTQVLHYTDPDEPDRLFGRLRVTL